MITDFQYNILLSCCYFTVFVILHHVWLKKYRSFNFHRISLLFMPILAAFLPWVTFTSKNNSISEIETFNLKPIIVSSDSTNAMLTVSQDQFTVFNGLLSILIIGTVVSLIFLVKNMIQLQKNKPKKHTLIDGCKVYFSENEAWTFGRSIIIPQNLEKEAQEIIFTHEKTHAKQLHSFDIVFSEIIKSILWWNPVVYLWKNDIRLNHEFIADNEVLKRHDKQAYGVFLLNTTFNTHQFKLTNTFFNPSILKRRIKMMKTQSKFMKVIPVVILTGVTITMTAFSNVQTNASQHKSQELVIAEDSVTSILDVQPSFPGGNEAMFKYLGTNIKYPNELKDKGVEEKLFIEFVVDKSGEIRDIKTLKGENQAFIDESIRVIKAMPNWSPGEKDGKKVNAKMVLPFMYKLSDDEK